MLQNFNGVEFVIGDEACALQMPQVHPLPPFAKQTVAFLHDLSALLRGCRTYSDAASFGFWCRKSAVLLEKEHYPDAAERLGRGVVFHSTPSNVPLNFAFSFAAGLLAGNANIVRLPAKAFPQVDLVCDAIRRLLTAQHAALQPYICFVKYAPSQEISDLFSSLCDMRVVWGGDRTVSEMRCSPLPPRAGEITFADRHSVAVIQADAYLQTENKRSIIVNFYNDTYYTDQNACTSPRMIFWMGSHVQEARTDFWARVRKEVQERYQILPVQAVGKLDALYRAANAFPLRTEQEPDMRLTRLVPEKPDAELMDYKYNSGFFFEYNIRSLAEMLPVCTRRCQTVTYFGIPQAELRTFVEQSAPHGIDRIVPMGKSMDFSLIWDGHDLIRELSRRITVI